LADKSVVITPAIFLPWLRKKLEEAGVKFVRKDLKSLSDLKGFGHEVLVNATGFGSKFLTDVADQNVQQIRGQTVLVKTPHDKIFMRHGKDYTYVIPRLDGTAILGGIKQVDQTWVSDILWRVLF
jgi:glycine/D-amino acid oxidase-like deaminating enzyme